MVEEKSGTMKPFLWVAAFVVVTAILFLKFRPLQLNPIGANLEGSWRSALAYASEKYMRFGTDVVFTGGPLSGVFTRQFQSEAPFQIAAYSLLLVAYLGSAFAFILHKKHSSAATHLIVAVAFLMCFLTSDSALLSVPFMAGIVGVAFSGRAGLLLSVAGAVLSGIVSLAKFSVFPLAVVCLLMADLCSVKRRQPPLHLILMLLAFCLAFIASGQAAGDILPFIISSLEVSSGYSSAMGINGPPLELALYIVEAAVLMLVVAFVWLDRKSGLDFIHRSSLFIVFAVFIFITFKAGFVRHDLHSLSAWGALSIAFIALVITVNLRSHFAFMLLAASILPAHVVLTFTTGQPWFADTFATIREVNPQLSLLRTFVLDHGQWLSDRQNEQAQAKARLSRNSGLDGYSGTMDIIPSDQSLLIAAGKKYHPHPTIQEYTSYSSRLIARNRAFFESDNAPEFVVFAPGSIDDRHPASAEGALWPLFLSRYEPVEEQFGRLILARRQTPLSGLESSQTSVKAKIGDMIQLPETNNLVMAKISITPRLFGKALDVLYKPPQTLLVVTYDDGSEAAYRLIPEMAKEGFLISPLVSSSSDYLSVAMGRSGLPSQRARSFRLVMGKAHQLVYDTAIRVEFRQIDVSALRSDKSDFLERSRAKVEALDLLLLANPMKPPSMMLVPEGLLAHAPMSLRLPVAGKSNISLGFGIRPGAWKDGGESDGACFLVKDGDRVLMERCLNPKDVEADRGVQSITLDVPAGASELSLETACRINCAWDWTYWSRAVSHP